MNISLNWLKEYVDFGDKTAEEIAEVLTLNSAEIERVVPYFFPLDSIVIGRVEKLSKHPNADKLKLCMVNNGDKTVQIVCGGANLYENMLVVVAKPGSQVRWHGEGELITLQPTTIRGEESEGMICASEEIGLEDFFPQKGKFDIMDVTDHEFPIGAALSEVLELDDTIFEVDNTAITHRPDLFSHRGFAQECVTNGLGKWKKQAELEMPKSSGKSFALDVDIVDAELVHRYSAMIIKNVPVKESPLWLKKRLDACGIRPINSHVDITNFVMLESGMPTHSFDLDLIKGKRVRLRESKEGESVTTLDGQKRKLPAGIIVFEDTDGIFDLCGLMGGERSGITDSTSNIWFHAPVYNRKRIRKAIQTLAHRTDAATIYEKGVPVSAVEDGMKQAWHLIKKIYPQAQIEGPVLDIQNAKEKKRVLSIDEGLINKLTGLVFDEKKVRDNLAPLGFEVKKGSKKDTLDILVPPHRYGDINISQDLIEEIIRIYGINNIEAELPHVPIKSMALPQAKAWGRIVRNTLKSAGFIEAYNYSFLGEELLTKCLCKSNKKYARVKNFLTEDTALMRQSLIPRLLENTANSLRYSTGFRIFELGRTYKLEKDAPVETQMITGLIADDDYEFLSIKGVIEDIADAFSLKVDYIQKDKGLEPYMHAGRTAELLVEGESLGYISEIHPKVLKQFDIKRKRIAFFDIKYDVILKYGSIDKEYLSLAKFPSSTLDINIVIPKLDAAKKYEEIVRESDNFLIKEVKILDEYSGEQIQEDKRSITMSIEYNAADRTLTEKEVQNIHETVVSNLQQSGAELRT